MSKNHCSLRDQGRRGRGGQTCVLSRDKKRNDSSRLIALLIATPSSIPSVRRRKPLPRPFPWRQKSRKRAERDSLIIFTGGERWFASSAAILTWLPRLPRGKMSSKEEVGFVSFWKYTVPWYTYFKRKNGKWRDGFFLVLKIIVFRNFGSMNYGSWLIY